MPTPNDVTHAHRVDLITAREHITRRASGERDVDLTAAALLLLRVSHTSRHIHAYHRDDLDDVRAILADDDTSPDTLTAAASVVDVVLDETCSHDPATWYALDAGAGQYLVKCPGCGVAWLSPDGAGMPDVEPVDTVGRDIHA